jgi:hypothetical protein
MASSVNSPHLSSASVAHRVALRLQDIADMIGISVRHLQTLRSKQQFPGPDRMLGRVPLWSAETVHAWFTREAGR